MVKALLLGVVMMLLMPSVSHAWGWHRPYPYYYAPYVYAPFPYYAPVPYPYYGYRPYPYYYGGYYRPYRWGW